MPMTRTQVYLTEEQHRLMQQLAARQEASMASLIREALQEYIARRMSPTDPLQEIIGLGASGVPDGALRHDRDIYDEVP